MAAMVEAAAPLPRRLMDFLVKYPPKEYSMYFTGQRIPTIKERVSTGAKPLSATNLPTILPTATPIIPLETTSDSFATTTTEQSTPTITEIQPESSIASATASASIPTSSPQKPSTMSRTTQAPNPFLPYRNPATGRWRGATIGLRRQAELFKLAKQHGVEELLPPSRKSTTFKEERLLERGLAVKGTGEDQKVKGHKWERRMMPTMEKRRKAMEEMPELIRLWEERGHGRGWKKYPSK